MQDWQACAAAEFFIFNVDTEKNVKNVKYPNFFLNRTDKSY